MRAAGGIGSANAGTSNDKQCERHLSPKVQGFLRKVNLRRVSRSLRRGRKGVADGNHVNIRGPVGGDEFQKLSAVTGFRGQRRSSRK